ncbi:hypothetical protein [Pengzhenrongella sicca]|uniref:Uncharacterized protein n=1 Tax=Pengzhenrongella sicca TaxID=2819238 RepID=A0A8A4ZHD0_9MICO|nr:hypothetical protein [Pengzhenrongella sicca]QTE30675.1 hypothetical protein J4E96_06860 [Pengzhenrongella sicca]
MKSAYRVLALLIALGVAVQAASIAYGWFQVISDVDAGAVYTSDTELNAGHALHGTVGVMVIPLLAVALLIVAFFARLRGGVRSAVIIFVLVVVQIALAFAAFGAPIVGALHGLNALAILGTALTASRLGSRPRAGAAAPASRAAA